MNTASLPSSVQAEISRWPTTLVTGATSGIGLALVTTLASCGVHVVACGRDPSRLASLRELGSHVHAEPLDLARLDALPARLMELVRRYPDMGVLFNNAGVQWDVSWFDEHYTAQDMVDEVAVNLTAPMMLAKVLLPQLMGTPQAMLVNIGSGLALAPKPRSASYCTAKAGLHAFTRALRLQMKDKGVRVAEAVMPLVDTPMTAGRGRAKISPVEAVRQTLEGLVSGKDEVWVGKARLLPVLQRLSPSLLSAIMQKL